MAWSDNVWASRLDTASKACAVAAVFVLPFPVALFSITMGIAAVLWIASGQLAEKLRRALANPVVPWVLVVIGLLIVGVSYSTGAGSDIQGALSKYSKLLYIPVLVSILYDPVWRARALGAFFVSLVAVLILSYGKLVGVVPTQWLAVDGPFTIAKTKILHSILMSILVYLALHKFLKRDRWRWWYLAIALAGVANLFFMVVGRIGYLLVAALLVVLAIQRGNWKSVVACAAAAVMTIPLLYFTSSSFRGRIEHSHAEWVRYQTIRQAGQHVGLDNSIGIRLEHYVNTAQLIRNHPLLGTGTGSWKQEYRALVSSEDAAILLDAHNEYLMLWVQLGIVGLACYLAMLYQQWRASWQLDGDARAVAQAMVVMIVASGLFNASLLYSHEGKVYVVMIGVAFAGLTAGVRRRPPEVGPTV